MASSQAYLRDVRQHLLRALCLHNFPSQQVERHNKPEVEVGGSPELLLPAVALARGEAERCLIEQSINSTRASAQLQAHSAVLSQPAAERPPAGAASTPRPCAARPPETAPPSGPLPK